MGNVKEEDKGTGKAKGGTTAGVIKDLGDSLIENFNKLKEGTIKEGSNGN